MKHVAVPCTTARSQNIGVNTIRAFLFLLALLCRCTSGALVAGGEGEATAVCTVDRVLSAGGLIHVDICRCRAWLKYWTTKKMKGVR